MNKAALLPHSKCHGCSLCLLSCPMWQQHRDVQFSPQGIAKALQHNASLAEIVSPLFNCLLCGACDILCPEQIDITGMITQLRKEALQQGLSTTLKENINAHIKLSVPVTRTAEATTEKNIIVLPGASLRSTPESLKKVLTLLSNGTSAALAHDDGDDIALALEAGIDLSDHRLHSFLEPLQGAKRLYVNNGLLLKQLRQWLPASKLFALGHSLSLLSSLSNKLQPGDLYLIEPCAFHLDHKQKVNHYEQLRHRRGCYLNLDLQRNAIPTAAGGINALQPQLDKIEQGRWILHGYNVQRIIVECAEDGHVMAQVSDLPVLHIADLMES